MKKAKFWVALGLEVGEENVTDRYWFEIELSDQEYEELYQVWFDNNCNLTSWESDWDGHDKLFEKIDNIAYYALNDLLKKHEPEFVDPVEFFWEISKETEDEF